METVMNAYRVRVKKCCASCGLKEVDNDGNRICTGMQLKVTQKFVCPKWSMSYALQQAGRSGGVVRLLGNKKIFIR